MFGAKALLMEARETWVAVAGEVKVREKKVVLTGGVVGVLVAVAEAELDHPPMGAEAAGEGPPPLVGVAGGGGGGGAMGREPLVPEGGGDEVGRKAGAKVAVTLPEEVRVRVEEGELDMGRDPLVPVGKGEPVGAPLLMLLGDTLEEDVEDQDA